MVAGSDTTAKAIKWRMHHLFANPSVRESLTLEIRTAIAEARVSDPISYQEAQELPFLQASLSCD